MASSMEEVSTQQDLSGDSKFDDSVTTDQQFGVFKDFDFLEYELESQEVGLFPIVFSVFSCGYAN